MVEPKLSIRSRKAQQPDGFKDHASPLDDLTNSAAVYLDWNDGRISKIYHSESESTHLVNYKKGVASLFQVQNSNGDSNEVDASGSCIATYKIVGDRTFLKNKKDCKFQRPTSSFARPQKVTYHTFLFDFISHQIFYFSYLVFHQLAATKQNMT